MPTYRAGTGGGNVSSASVASISAPALTAVAGDAVIATAGRAGTWNGAISDGTAYTQDINASAAGASFCIASRLNVGAGSLTVTYTPTASSWCVVSAAAYSGVATSSAYETGAGATGFSASADTGSCSPTAGSLMVGGVSIFYSVTSWGTGPAGYTQYYQGNASGYTAEWCHYKESAASSENAAWTWTGNQNWACCVASYLAAAAGGLSINVYDSITSSEALD